MTLFLDEELRMCWFTPAVCALVPVQAGDVGRRITDLALRFRHPSFLDDVRAVMQSGEPREAEVRTFDDRWYHMRIRPFRTGSEHGGSAGVAITFGDVTDRKRIDEALRESRSALTAELDAMRQLHQSSTAIMAARSLSELLEVALDAIIGLHGADFGNVQLYEPQTGMLHIAAHRGFERSFLDRFAAVAASAGSASSQAMLHRTRVVFPDIEAGDHDASYRALARQAGYRAAQSTPLTTAAGGPLGMISTHFKAPRVLSEAENRLTDILAHELSGALERVRVESALRDNEAQLRIDINDRKRAEQALRESERILRRSQVWLAAQKEAFQSAMNGADLATSLAILVRTAVEQCEVGCRCAFYVANAVGTQLRHVVGMPESYAQRVDGFAISPESLACGLAVATGEPVVTPDVVAEPKWERWRWLAHEYDYRGCWSFPLETSAGRLVGSFAMYFREPRQPTARDRELVAAVTQTAAIILSRHQATEERARAEAALRTGGERATS
jgi:GAF domain-containing protein